MKFPKEKSEQKDEKKVRAGLLWQSHFWSPNRVQEVVLREL